MKIRALCRGSLAVILLAGCATCPCTQPQTPAVAAPPTSDTDLILRAFSAGVRRGRRECEQAMRDLAHARSLLEMPERPAVKPLTLPMPVPVPAPCP